MLVGYMRVSSADDRQVLDLQRDALLAAGVDARHLFADKASGAKHERVTAGLAADRRRGRRGGRPPALSQEQVEQITQALANGASKASSAGASRCHAPR